VERQALASLNPNKPTTNLPSSQFPKPKVVETLSSPLCTIRIPPLQASVPHQVDPAILSKPESEDGEGNAKCMFCPEEDCAGVILLMEIHYNTHPLIPGYSAPTKEGIQEWAVKQMYQYCKSCDLAALWAYLWENWY